VPMGQGSVACVSGDELAHLRMLRFLLGRLGELDFRIIGHDQPRGNLLVGVLGSCLARLLGMLPQPVRLLPITELARLICLLLAGLLPFGLLLSFLLLSVLVLFLSRYLGRKGDGHERRNDPPKRARHGNILQRKE